MIEMTQMKINLAEDFSEFPAGRYKTDGPSSGEAFRDDLLVPALKTHDIVYVDLDGTLGLGSSFLEEAFGGLIRKSGFKKSEVEKKLKVSCSLESYSDEVWDYIRQA